MERLGTAKLFVGVAGNDVIVNNKGGATCKLLLQAFSLVTTLIKITHTNSLKSHGSSPFARVACYLLFLFVSKLKICVCLHCRKYYLFDLY